MLRKLRELIGYKISATDGDIGKVKDLFFDDESWRIRYLVADTGGWLTGRKVLIPNLVLGEPDWSSQTFPVGMTRQQVEESPPIEEDEPVSRQHEISLHKYLAIEPYWMAPPGGGFVAAESAVDPGVQKEKKPEGKDEGDPNLRSALEVKGYHINAVDGEVGHVEDFVVDDDRWIIRYLVVDPHNILPGRMRLVAVPWIDKIDWADSKVHVDMEQDLVKNAPEFDASAPVNRRYEERVYDYYGRPSYWG